MLPTVFRIQSVDKVSIVFSTGFASISFAETNNIGAFTQFTLHIYVIYVNTQWGWENGRHFPDDTSKRIFLNENVWISIKISPKFVH